jgi:hypothetical protein
MHSVAAQMFRTIRACASDLWGRADQTKPLGRGFITGGWAFGEVTSRWAQFRHCRAAPIFIGRGVGETPVAHPTAGPCAASPRPGTASGAPLVRLRFVERGKGWVDNEAVLIPARLARLVHRGGPDGE